MRRAAAVAAALFAALLVVAGCTSDSVLDLEVGDCLSSEQLDTSAVASIEALDCADEHDGEVYGEHVFPDGDYPGEDEVADASDAACREQFESFVGVAYDDSSLYYTSLHPTADGWRTADDRTALCVLLIEAPITGSLHGSGI